MWQRTLMMSLAAVVLVGVLGLGQALAQPRPGDGPPGDRPEGDRRGSHSPEEMRARMEEFRARMAERQREQLGATEEDMKILQPRIEKIQQLQRQARGGGGGFTGFGGGGRGPGGGDSSRQPEGTPERERSEVELKTEALRSLLADENANASSIKAALDALRAARKRVEDELVIARRDLRDVCTARQEGQFVLQGILD